jgi:hypothetical protein
MLRLSIQARRFLASEEGMPIMLISYLEMAIRLTKRRFYGVQGTLGTVLIIYADQVGVLAHPSLKALFLI